MNMYLVMERELLVVSGQDGQWRAEPHLAGMLTTCVAVDPFRPERVYCGTFGRGLWRSDDAGHNWVPVGDAGSALGPWTGEGIAHAQITSIAVSPVEQSLSNGVVFAGTEPSALFRSDNGGETWRELQALRELPSAPTWSFPPRPYTSHTRWITPDPLVPGRLFAAIEAGALVRSTDGGEHWEDRRPDSPYDTHTLLMHPLAPDRLYSAAGDGFGRHGRGYNESHDAGMTWQRPDEGLQHHYLWSLAVDPADPDTILVSAASSPMEAHMANLSPSSAIYRKTRSTPWERITNGLPEAQGTVIPVLASHSGEPGVFYLLSNKGLYRSPDAGITWGQINIPWKPEYVHGHQQALAVSLA